MKVENRNGYLVRWIVFAIFNLEHVLSKNRQKPGNIMYMVEVAQPLPQRVIIEKALLQYLVLLFLRNVQDLLKVNSFSMIVD